MTPTLLEAAEELAQGGWPEVSVVPMFLGAGGHVRRDLPQLVAALELRHPQVQWRLKPAIGEAPSVIQAMACEAAGLEMLTPVRLSPGDDAIAFGQAAIARRTLEES